MKRILALCFAGALLASIGCGDTQDTSGDDCNPGFADCAGNNGGNNGDNNGGNNGANNGDNNGDNNGANNGDNNGANNGANNGGNNGQEACRYPFTNARRAALGSVAPNVVWPDAYTDAGEVRELSLEQIHCDAEFAHIETIIIVFSAGWCPNCPAYGRMVQSEWADTLVEENALLIWMEIETTNYQPADGSSAWNTFGRYYSGPGFRVGDKNASVPFAGSPLVRAFPSQAVIRKSDMKVIASSSTSQYLMPLVQIARHPDADWSDAGANTLPTDVGIPCSREVDCDPGTLIPVCIQPTDERGQPTGWVDGYCTGLTCKGNEACGDSNLCATVSEDGLTACFQGCTSGAEGDCRTGYECQNLGGPTTPTACLPPQE